MNIRTRVRAVMPYSWRLRLACARRALGDGLRRDDTPELGPVEERALLIEQVRIRQPIRRTALSAGKLTNLRLAASRIEPLVLRDGRMFSFWGAIGAPTPARGYVAGRAIVADRLDESIGGGLCQLSGALYELALRGGLEIVERRAHSHDLYSEAERFTPLGLDATVVFGFTDLRFRNRTGATIAFRLQVDDDELSVALCASAPLELFDLRVNSSECAGGWVETQVEKIVADGSRRDVIRQRYLRLSDDGGETEAQAARQSRR